MTEPPAKLGKALSRDSSAVVVGADANGGELRRNLASGTWSCHFPKKPRTAEKKPMGYSGMVKKGDPPTHAREPRNLQADPFDLEKASTCPVPTTTVFDPEYPELPMIRVINNKFPAMQPSDGSAHELSDWVQSVPAVGLHRVVIQHWRYNTCLALSTPEECSTLWLVLRDQIQELSQLGSTRYVQCIENHGPRSGGSLPHPHSQILALPIVPSDIETRLQLAAKYYTDNNHSVYEQVTEDARTAGRVLVENEHVIAMVPAAIDRGHDIWIIPQRPGSCFSEATDEEVHAAAQALRVALGMLYVQRDDPDYNLLLRTAPTQLTDVERLTGRNDVDNWYRWHIEVIPHHAGAWAGVKAYGGFALQTGTPEDQAQSLQDHLSDEGTVQMLPTSIGRDQGTQLHTEANNSAAVGCSFKLCAVMVGAWLLRRSFSSSS